MEAAENCYTELEEQGSETDHQPQHIPGDSHFTQPVCRRAGWQTSQQFGARKGQGVSPRYSMVDDSCCSCNIYQLHGQYEPSISISGDFEADHSL